MASFRLTPLPSIKDLLNLYRVRALKNLSQNFLLDSRITNKIVKASGTIEDDFVIEVGPGPGGITRSILNKNPRKLVVIEKDRRFLPMLEHLADSVDGKMNIIIGDVMNFNMEHIIDQSFKKDWQNNPPNIHIIGNLPFNIATPLIIKWLKKISIRSDAWANGRVRMTLTFQNEVAERIVAHPNSSQRCRLSVMCQNWCRVSQKMIIPGTAFLPKPDVNVGVVHFVPWKNPRILFEFDVIEKIVRSIFSHRQKYSVRGAQTLFPLDIRESLANEMYELAELSKTIRPYNLTDEKFARLCQAYKTICDKNPKYYKFNYNNPKSFEEEEEEQKEADKELLNYS